MNVPVTEGPQHELGCSEMHFHASPKCCADGCYCKQPDPVANVATPFPADKPNQLLLELLKQADAIDELVVIARDKNGRLYVTWTEQDLGSLCEATQLLVTTAHADLYTGHCANEPEDEHPPLKLSFLANGELEPVK